MAAQIARDAARASCAAGRGRARPAAARPPARARVRPGAALLARGLAARLGLPLAPLLVPPRPRGAARPAPAARAPRGPGGSHRRARRATPAGPVLLVDDVHTTGATLDACARALVAAGAGRVMAVTYARTL